MPAEWEPHLATWISWPNRTAASFPDDHPENLAVVRPVFLELIRLLSTSEKVFVNVAGEDEQEWISSRLTADELATTRFFPIDTREPWCRDYGPTFVTDSAGGRAAVKWNFNAWGERYPPFDVDNGAGRKMAELFGVPCLETGFTFEGGGVEVDGRGTAITSESCILNRNRQPRKTKTEVEALFCRYLGINELVWLPGGDIAGDDTDGHVDVTTRFAGPGRILAARCTQPDSPNFAVLREKYRRLKSWRDERAPEIEIVPIPMPETRWHPDRGIRLPATYANFYLTNDQVIIPIYHDPLDDQACEIIAASFPGRTPVPFDCSKLIAGQGAIHCLTQQVPAIPEDHQPNR